MRDISKVLVPYLTKKQSPFLAAIRSASFKTKDESTLPEFIYAGKNIKPRTRVYVMGVTTNGALGVRDFIQPQKGRQLYRFMHHPYRMTFCEHYKVEDIACGYGFTVLVVKNEDAVFFGTGLSTNCQIGYHSPRTGHPLEIVTKPTPIGVPLREQSRVKKVACGRSHTIVWTDVNGLLTFGNNSFGQCGRRVIPNEDYASKVIFHRVAQFDGKNVEQIECGQDTSFVLCEGKVYSCGWSADGQTGRGTYQNVDTFGPVHGDLKGEKVIKVSSKADCVLALTDKGEVFGWGNSEYRQLGSNTDEQQMNTPKKINLNIEGRIVDIVASGTSCFVVTDVGDVWAWGYGILGRGPECQNSEEPKLIPNTLLGRNILNPDSKVTKIFAGTSMAAAVTNDGSLFTWGRNVGGVLGLGHTKFQHFPMRVCIAGRVDKVSCGADHMAVIAKSLM